jgi:hypothetical protein
MSRKVVAWIGAAIGIVTYFASIILAWIWFDWKLALVVFLALWSVNVTAALRVNSVSRRVRLLESIILTAFGLEDD